MAEVMVLFQYEFMTVIAVMVAAVVVYQASKMWRSPGGVTLTSLLGSGLVVVATVLYVLRNNLSLGVHRNAMLFVLLYAWCASGLLFLSGRQTHPFKLFLGLLAQAVILYYIYKWTRGII